MDSTDNSSRSIRNIPPAHYLMKVESYSLLSKAKKNYDSSYFEAGGYKWRLSFFPNGDQRDDTENDHISLYLAISDQNTLPNGWEVNVIFKLFVYNQLKDNYLTVQDIDGAVRRFHKMKREWGFERLVSLETFKDLSNGYLLNDSCVFGAEVFVISHTLNWESLSVYGRGLISNPRFSWEIKEFSKMEKDSYESEVFAAGGTKWHLRIHPKGDEENGGKYLSIYLFLDDSGPNNSTIYADCCLRVLDQVNSKHKEFSVNQNWFRRDYGWGTSEFILLEDLHKSSNGYILKDTLIVEVEFMAVSRTKVSIKDSI